MAVDHRDTEGVARYLAQNTDPRIAQQGRRLAAMFEAQQRGVTDPEELRAISRAVKLQREGE